MRRRDFLASLPAAAFAGQTAHPSSYALLDPALIERSSNAMIVTGPVEKDSLPLFGEDKPWEVRIDNLYANVLFDDRDRRFKCWYSPFIQFHDRWDGQRWIPTIHGMAREMAICFADSTDGIHWGKPDLGLSEFEGNRHNNIVWRGPHGSGIFLDRHETNPARRFKIFFNQPDPNGTRRAGETQMATAFSADGLHWTAPVVCPTIDARGDTHNNAFWDARSGRYVAFTRLFVPGDQGRPQRTVGRTESEDFVHWTKAEPVLQGTVEDQTYAMPVMPYHQGYLGLVMIFHTVANTVDCELAWSSDTRQWQRIAPGHALIPRGSQGAPDHGCIFAAAYPVTTADATLLYYGGSDHGHNGPRKGYFCRARMRRDGFAGIAPARPGEVATWLTKPIVVTGRRICICADAAGGQLRVGITGSSTHTIQACIPVERNVTNLELQWRGAGGLAAYLQKPVQFEIESHSAPLYTLNFTT